jgi:phospholipid-binding lipoprotein MlaA
LFVSTPDKFAPALRATLLGAIFALGACTAKTGDSEFNDPYEAQNRAVFNANLRIDTALFGGDKKEKGPGLPEPIARGVTNFAANLEAPGNALNSALQGRVEPLVANTFRFLINTTVGIGGIFDPATEIGIPERKTDFGQTLHVWGAPQGAYLVVPLAGPTTQRDLAGKVVDILIDPLGAVIKPPESYATTGLKFGAKIIKRQRFSQSVDSILYESADSYAQTRLIYLQNRNFELGVEAEVVDPYENPYGQ